MKIAVLPRDANPYQACLYREMASLGDTVRYLGELTPSQTVNIALLPFELARARLSGIRVLHLHWVYRFALPGLSRFTAGRRLLRSWFAVVLRTAHVLHIRVVWVAHNVLPHDKVFDDDVAARRTLLGAADTVVAHEVGVLTQLALLAPLPARRTVVRHPAYDVPYTEPQPVLDRPLQLLFFGTLARYKGVPDLLRAVQLAAAQVQLLVAGVCKDDALRAELEELAAAAATSTSLRLERLGEDELESALAACDLVVLPFTDITTSGSVFYALSAGRPVLVPDMPTLVGLPNAAVLRYARGSDPVGSLAAAIDDVAGHADELLSRGRAARGWARAYTWAHLAAAMHEASQPSGDIPVPELEVQLDSGW